jgi:hypothetical protein
LTPVQLDSTAILWNWKYAYSLCPCGQPAQKAGLCRPCYFREWHSRRVRISFGAIIIYAQFCQPRHKLNQVETTPVVPSRILDSGMVCGEMVSWCNLEQVRPAVERAFSSGVPYCLNVNIRGVRSPFTEWQIAGKK